MGLLEEGFGASCETDVKNLVRISAQKLAAKGAVVEDVSIPSHLDGKYVFKYAHTRACRLQLQYRPPPHMKTGFN